MRIEVEKAGVKETVKALARQLVLKPLMVMMVGSVSAQAAVVLAPVLATVCLAAVQAMMTAPAEQVPEVVKARTERAEVGSADPPAGLPAAEIVAELAEAVPEAAEESAEPTATAVAEQVGAEMVIAAAVVSAPATQLVLGVG